MKKTIYILLLSLLYACTGKESGDNRSDVAATPAEEELFSLNGIGQQDASRMVADFQKDRRSSSAHTSIWIDKKFFEVLAAARREFSNADGVRFYFAKKDNKNTVVMVLTTNEGPSSENKKVDIHKDLFHPKKFSFTINEKDHAYNEEVKGAYLYQNVCPKPGPCTEESYVDCHTAANWVEHFANSQHETVMEKVNKRSVWYSFNVFEQIEKEIKNNNGDGFRLYYAKNDCGNYGFILVPTTAMANSNGHNDDYSCLINKNLIADKNNIAAHDRGEECTPFCDGVTLPLPDPDPQPEPDPDPNSSHSSTTNNQPVKKKKQ